MKKFYKRNWLIIHLVAASVIGGFSHLALGHWYWLATAIQVGNYWLALTMRWREFGAISDELHSIKDEIIKAGIK